MLKVLLGSADVEMLTKSIFLAFSTSDNGNQHMLNCYVGTSLVSHWLRHHALNAGGPGSILGQGTTFHIATTKTQHSQIFFTNATLT